MNKLSLKLFFICFAVQNFCFLNARADQPNDYRNQFFIGPEIYHVKRTKEEGISQKGEMYGVRLGYDYVRRSAIYFGVDELFAHGTLKGHRNGIEIKSTLRDANLEGRLGYTFQSKGCYKFSFSPFIGIGYFWETNKYKHPSPLHIHFHNKFAYVPVGFLSRFFPYPHLSVGINFKARILFDGKVLVTHDNGFEDRELGYEEKIQYRVDIPVTYYFCWCNHNLAASLVPFYEYRNYGHRANFPFDFLETKFKIYGADLQLRYVF